MNKSELVAAIDSKLNLGKRGAERALDAVLDTVVDEIGKGGEVALVGFGTFTAVDRAERPGRNPQTGESLTIPAKRVPKFVPGKRLKDAVASR